MADTKIVPGTRPAWTYTDSDGKDMTITANKTVDKSWLDEDEKKSITPDYYKRPDDKKKTESTISDATKKKSKTVLTKDEAKAAGYNLEDYPTEAFVNRGMANDKNGYIDAEGNLHLNSKYNENRSAKAKDDIAKGRDYKTATAPSQYELDLRNKNLGTMNVDGSYTYSNEELQNIINKYGKSDPELKKAAEDELAKRNGGKSGSDKKTTGGKVEEPKSEGLSAGISTDKPSEDTPIKSGKDVEKKVENPPTKADEVRKFGKDLSKFVIQSYLRGDFGKKSDPNAIASMGYYLLDKIGSALVNASQVARGLTPTAKSQWSKLLEQQTDLLGKGMTAEWFNGLTPEQQAAVLKTGGIQGTTATALNENVSDTSDKTREMDMEKKTLEIKKLNQDQKNTAQNNLNALITRKSELQALISKLKSDQGWGSYVEAMNAVVGTAKGLETVGATSSTASSDSSNKSSTNTLSGTIGTGSVPSAFVSASIGDSQTWNSGSTSSSSRNAGSSLNKDSLALSKFKDAEGYAKAGKEAQMEANKQLISQLEDQIKVIDNCIASWGKDLGINK